MRPTWASDAIQRRWLRRLAMRYLVAWGLGLLTLAPVMSLLARWSVKGTVWSLMLLLRLVPLKSTAAGALITVGTTQIRIVGECTPLIPSILLGMAMFAYPTRVAWKLVGVAFAMLALWIYNVVRVLLLTAFMMWKPWAFSIVHVYVWGVLTAVVLCCVYLAWLRLVPRGELPA